MSMLVVLNNFIRKRAITKSRDDRSDYVAADSFHAHVQRTEDYKFKN